MSIQTGLCSRSLTITTFSAALAAMLAAPTAFAATINVPGDAPTIQAAIAAAVPGDLILVAPGTYSEHLDLLGKSLTIRGSAGAALTTISGSASAGPVVSINTIPGGVRLEGLTISGGSLATGGGAGISSIASSIRVENCVVESNICIDGFGAGLAANGGSVEIVSSTFRNNAATVSVIGNNLGAALSVIDASLTITGSLFDNNEALELGGGAIGASGTSTVAITNSTFTNNRASTTSTGSVSTTFGGGGAIATRDSVTLNITGGSFATNTVTRGNGSAIKIIGTGNPATIFVDGTSFNGNIANGNGAIESAAAGGMEIRNAIFENNVANVASGAAIAQGSTTAPANGSIIANCTFRNNTSGIAGALDILHRTTITDSLFEGNRAVGASGGSFIFSGGSGAVRVNSGTQLTTFERCTFRNNNVNTGATADNEGGAVRVRRSNVAFIDCTFTGNTATNNRGGALFFSALQSGARTALIRNCTFTGNETLGPNNQQGGAIGMSGRIAVTIENSDFANNIAPNAGAHLWNEQQGANLTITNTVFRDASSRQATGIFYPARSDATVSITDTQFRNLNAVATPDNQGGDWAAANITANTIILNRVTIENNTARNNAGIRTDGTSATSTTTIENSTFRNLVATPVANNGGDIGAGEIRGGITIVRNVNVTDCSAKTVGGLSVFGSTSTLVENSTFTNCQGIPAPNGTSGDIGGLRLTGLDATARGLTFTNCRAKIGGGLWASASGTLTVEQSTFTGCQAIPGTSDNFGDGGGARIDGTNVILRDLTFTDNRARVGGALHVSGGGPTATTLLSNIIATGGIAAPAPGGNVTGARGGGIYISRPNARLDRVRVIGNTAGRGGGIWSDSLNATFTNVLAVNNTATDRGGGIMVDGFGGTPRPHTISSSTIAQNTNGGITFGTCDVSPVATISNSIIRDNTGPGNIVVFCATNPAVSFTNINGGYAGTGNISADPLFVNPATGNFALDNASPSINTGDNASLPSNTPLDLAGNPRVVATIDMGAFESSVAGASCEYDYNQDENVDLTDAQLMAQVAAGLITADPSWLSGDLNGDENADLTDAQILAAYVASGICGV